MVPYRKYIFEVFLKTNVPNVMYHNLTILSHTNIKRKSNFKCIEKKIYKFNMKDDYRFLNFECSEKSLTFLFL